MGSGLPMMIRTQEERTKNILRTSLLDIGLTKFKTKVTDFSVLGSSRSRLNSLSSAGVSFGYILHTCYGKNPAKPQEAYSWHCS